MTELDVKYALGRVEGELKGFVATLSRVDERSAARDGAFDELRSDFSTMASDIAALKDHAKAMIVVTQQFNALQQAIRDGTNQAKGISKGFGMGIAFAAAGTGAAVAGLGKELWKLVFG